MLYDPKWEQRADAFSLLSLIAWLERQDPLAEYCYSSNGECLLARYFRECGFNKVIMAAPGKLYAHHTAVIAAT